MPKKYKLFLSSFVFLFFFISTATAAENNYYPKPLIDSIRALDQDFTQQNINKTYDFFITHKGIKDATIAYTLVDIALKHKSKLDSDIINSITKFSIDDQEQIKILLSNNYFNRITLIPHYVSQLSIYTLVKYTTYIFVILMFFYLFIKNRFIFFHAHGKRPPSFTLFSVVALLFFAIGTGAFLPEYLLLFFGVAAVLLLIPEKINNRLILFSAIFIALVLNSVEYQFESDADTKQIHSLINSPVSLAYLNLLINENPDNYSYHVLKAIKYPESTPKKLNSPHKRMNKTDQVNLATYYLMNKNFKRFKKLMSFPDLLDNSILILNLSSYYSDTFQYKELEDINKRLYDDQFFYKIKEHYQKLKGKALYLPYSEDKLTVFTESFSLNTGKSIINSIFLFIALIIVMQISKYKELFKCSSCGEIYCLHCDDGFGFDQVCAACRNIIYKKSNAEAAILVKKTILMENNQERSAVFSRILSAILPGAGQIFMNHSIKGILMTLLFSLLIFLATFRFEPFIGPENYGLHMVITPVYIAVLVVFIIVYLINMFSRK